MGKKALSAGILLFAACITAHAQQVEGFSFQVNPAVSIPVGSSQSLFTIGGGAELAAQYSMPFAPIVCARALVDYTLAPTVVQTNLSLLSLGIGAGVNWELIPRLTLSAALTGGYGLGIYAGETGGSSYIGADAGLSYSITPSFALGAGAGYRHYFAQPDPFYQAVRVNLGTVIRLAAGVPKSNIEIPGIRLDPVFPVFYKYYDDHPVGEVTIRNTEKGAIRKLRVNFCVNQYMEGPKESAAVDEVKQGESVAVPLFGLFTDKVLQVTEATKVAATIVISYELAGREVTLSRTETLRLYDRNALTWDDDRKAAAFVTAKDPGILKLAKGVAGLVREHPNQSLDLNFRIGLALFESLRLCGVNYVVDPQSPYSSRTTAAVDFLQFPIQTLGYKGGDCDDLSICYSAMLESIGIETAFITVPGHIYAAFSLGMDPSEARKCFHNPLALIFAGDTVWLPVEITMVQDGFLAAWEKGAMEWREWKAKDEARLYPIHDAWQKYEPVGFPSVSDNVEAPSKPQMDERFTAVINRFVEREIVDQVDQYRQQISRGNDPSVINRLGVLYARYGLLAKAKEQFTLAARVRYLPSIVNLGNILFIAKQYDMALEAFKRAQGAEPDNAQVLLGIAKTEYELENMGTVKRVYERLQQKDPALAARFSYLVGAGKEQGRASAMGGSATVWDEE
jgi:hypothetical protein